MNESAQAARGDAHGRRTRHALPCRPALTFTITSAAQQRAPHRPAGLALSIDHSSPVVAVAYAVALPVAVQAPRAHLLADS